MAALRGRPSDAAMALGRQLGAAGRGGRSARAEVRRPSRRAPDAATKHGPQARVARTDDRPVRVAVQRCRPGRDAGMNHAPQASAATTRDRPIHAGARWGQRARDAVMTCDPKTHAAMTDDPSTHAGARRFRCALDLARTAVATTADRPAQACRPRASTARGVDRARAQAASGAIPPAPAAYARRRRRKMVR